MTSLSQGNLQDFQANPIWPEHWKSLLIDSWNVNRRSHFGVKIKYGSSANCSADAQVTDSKSHSLRKKALKYRSISYVEWEILLIR